MNGMRADLVWPDRALKSNFPGFLREPGDESPGGMGSTKWQNRDVDLIKQGSPSVTNELIYNEQLLKGYSFADGHIITSTLVNLHV